MDRTMSVSDGAAVRVLMILIAVALVGCASAVPVASPRATTATASAASPVAAATTSAAPIATPVPASPSPAPPTPSPTPRVPILHPDGSVEIPVPGPVTFLAAGNGVVYATTPYKVTRIDPATNIASPFVDLVVPPDIDMVGSAPAAVPGALWIVRDDIGNVLMEYDAATGRKVATVPVGEAPIEPMTAFGAIWSVDHHGGTITRVDPVRRMPVATIKISEPGQSGPLAAAAGSGRVWAVAGNRNALVAIDPQTNKIAKVAELGWTPRHVAFAGGRVWVWREDEPTVEAFDPVSLKHLGSIDVEGGFGRAIEAGKHVLIPDGPIDTPQAGLNIVDPSSLKVLDRVDVNVDAGAISAFGSLWVQRLETVVRIPLETFERP